jgi:hypothetical protein
MSELLFNDLLKKLTGRLKKTMFSICKNYPHNCFCQLQKLIFFKFFANLAFSQIQKIASMKKFSSKRLAKQLDQPS